jgi:hypothetical protein
MLGAVGVLGAAATGGAGAAGAAGRWIVLHPDRQPTAEAGLVTTAAVPDLLLPGAPAVDLVLTVSNPGPRTVSFTTSRLAEVRSDRPGSCPSAAVAVAPLDGLTLLAPARSTERHRIAKVVSMSADAPDGCQGAAFQITVTVTAGLATADGPSNARTTAHVRGPGPTDVLREARRR